jgi:hypothetical protein
MSWSGRGKQSGHGEIVACKHESSNGIFGIIICAGAIAAGVWFGLGGAYAGLILVPGGLFAGKFCLKLATMRSEIYEQGFVTNSWFESVTARYKELQSISRFAVRANGVLNTHVHFVTQSGEEATLIREALGHDDKMAQLLAHACESLASTWMKTLNCQKEVVWIMNGASPLLPIRKDGVIFQGKSGAEEFISLNEVQLKSRYAATVDICRGDAKVTNVNSASPNYLVGETLIAKLLENQRRPAATPYADPEKRAMAARATNSMA